MWLSYLHLSAKQNFLIFKYDEVIDILAWLPSDFCALKNVCITYHRKIVIMFPPLIGGALSDGFVWRLSVAYIGSKSRTERPIGRPKLTQRYSPRHMWLGHYFHGQKVKGQGHQAALLNAVLARPAAAAVGVGTCWPWKTAATLPSARRRKALRRPRGRRGGGISWWPATYSLFKKKTLCFFSARKSLMVTLKYQ